MAESPTRFDIERAVMASGIDPISRHLMQVLCARIDKDVHLILPRWQPSLSDLARDTGWSRRTVMRHLNLLEKDGWVIRSRPTPHDARAKHARTQYTPLIAGSYPQGGRARDTYTQDLGTPRPRARDTVPRSFSSESSGSGAATPEPWKFSEICGWCSKPHPTDKCPEREKEKSSK